MATPSVERRSGILAGWTTRDIVVTAAIAVVFGLLYFVWTYVYEALKTGLTAVLGPVGTEALTGFWFIAGVIVPYIVRKPGAAIIGETIAALVEMPFTPWGWTTVVEGFLQGVASEVPFAATRYRNYRLPVILLAGGLPTFTSFAYEYIPYEYGSLEVGVQIAMVVLRFISGIILGGLLAKAIADALAKTGVLSGFAIGREQREEV